MLTFDKHFYTALSQDEQIQSLTNGRIFNPARDEQSEDEDKVPYLIISNDGGNNVEESKDCDLEGNIDNVTISVLVVSETRESLATLAQHVREVLRDAAPDWERLQNYTLSASAVQMDNMKPCHYQSLTYQCEITPE